MSKMGRSWRPHLWVCLVLSLVALLDSASTQPSASPVHVLLQGPPVNAAALEAARGLAGDAGRETTVAQALQKVDLMRDLVDVSQVLEGEESLSPKVKVEVFMSAGSKRSRRVFHRVIASVLQKDSMFEIVDLSFVMWGNGDIVGEDGASLDAAGIAGLADASAVQFACDGDPSCAGNTWEACLVSKVPAADEYFPVLNCIEGRTCTADEHAPEQCYGEASEVAPICAFEFGEGLVSSDELRTCAEGDEGRAVLLQNAQLTAALDPPMQFLPWILVDGEALGTGEDGEDEQLLLGKAICDAYASKGGELPFACSKFPQSLEDVSDPWGVGPTADDIVGVPLVGSDVDSWGVPIGIFMLVAMLGFVLVLAYCCCEPREEDKHLFDAIGGRPWSRDGTTISITQPDV
jgi:hypothetical protein